MHEAPVGAVIELNERPVREVDEATERLQLPAGQYRVRITAPGHLAARHDVELAPGQAWDLRGELWPTFPGVDDPG